MDKYPYQQHDNTPSPAPQEMAARLRTDYSEGEALDLILVAAKRWGWTPQLNATGLHLLKPNAPRGAETSA